MWAKAIKLGPEVPGAFKREIHVREADSEYWLHIQEVLSPDLQKEGSRACAADLYVMWLGSAKGDWVFIVNEFQFKNSAGLRHDHAAACPQRHASSPRQRGGGQ